MRTMQRHSTYPPLVGGQTSPKYHSSHSTSSAFSASANPNEDWTKISDLAERRRIQNRIAQRNYRKKIKRRLEDLERRAGSSSASPEQSHTELAPMIESRRIHPKEEDGVKRQRSRQNSSSRKRNSPDTHSQSFPMVKTERSASPPYQYGRELSISPPPSYGYSYSLPEPVIHASYPQHTPYNTLPAPYPDYTGQPQYLPPLPPTLPSMPQYDAGPTKPNYLDEDVLSHYGSGYTPFASMDLPMQQSYPDSNVHTPPLSHSHSFEYSRGESPSVIFPSTPGSIPDSPNVVIR